MMKKTLLAAVVLGFGASFAFAEDTVDNPAYLNWAKFKAGATQKVSMSTTMKMGEQEMSSSGTMTSTLKELTAEKAVIEVAVEMTAMGKTMTAPAQKLEIKAKVPAGTATQPAGMNVPEGAKVTRTGSGDEEVAVGGKKYKCHWEEYQIETTKPAAMKMTAKVWISKEVPGGLVKQETSGDMPQGKMTSKMELVEFKDGA